MEKKAVIKRVAPPPANEAPTAAARQNEMTL